MDLVPVILGWETGAPDVTGDCVVAVPDLTEVIAAFGACP